MGRPSIGSGIGVRFSSALCSPTLFTLHHNLQILIPLPCSFCLPSLPPSMQAAKLLSLSAHLSPEKHVAVVAAAEAEDGQYHTADISSSNSSNSRAFLRKLRRKALQMSAGPSGRQEVGEEQTGSEEGRGAGKKEEEGEAGVQGSSSSNGKDEEQGDGMTCEPSLQGNMEDDGFRASCDGNGCSSSSNSSSSDGGGKGDVGEGEEEVGGPGRGGKKKRSVKAWRRIGSLKQFQGVKKQEEVREDRCEEVQEREKGTARGERKEGAIEEEEDDEEGEAKYTWHEQMVVDLHEGLSRMCYSDRFREKQV